MRKSQVVGVGLVSAWLGRKEGQGRVSKGLECLARGVGFLQQTVGSHGLLLSTKAMLPKWDLREIHQAGPLGRASEGPGLGAGASAWRRGDACCTLAFPPDPWLPSLLAKGLFHPSAASGCV